MTAAGLRLRAEPLSALVDELVCIQVTGAMPDTLVTIAARAMDGTGEQWSAQAVFRSGPEGDVDVAAQRPLMGSYESVDPMGLFWSMVPDGNSDMLLPVAGGEAVSVSLVARTERGTTSPEVILTRHFRHRDTRRIAIRASGLVGTLFRRENGPLAPGVVVLGGSGGGAPEDIAGLLASYGLTTLALAYFGALPLPAALVEIPLEYVRNAILWLRAQDGVRPGRISIVGRSRGGELALLAGATFSEVGAVVAYVPSALTWWGLQGGGWSGRSAWSYRGRGLPCPGPSPFRDVGGPAGHGAVSGSRFFAQMLADRVESCQQAAIEVERIHGDVLLISGGRDEVWPSTALAEMARDRRERHCRTCQHLDYPGAGHAIWHPHVPTTVTAVRHSLTGRQIGLGGTPAGTAQANADSWPQVLRVLGATSRS